MSLQGTKIGFEDARRVCEEELCAMPASSGEEDSSQRAATSSFFGVSQERFLSALSVAIESNDQFANVFVSGISGPGGLEAVEWHVSRMVRERENIGDKKPAPNDWVYVYNFKNPRSPVSIPLTKGNARVFQKKMWSILKKYNRFT